MAERKPPQNQAPRPTPADAPRSRPREVVLPASGIFVFESRHAEDFEMQPEAWPFHKLCLIASGQGLLEWRGRRYPLETGQLLFLPAGLSHRFLDAARAPLVLALACFDAAALERLGLHEALEPRREDGGEPRRLTPADPYRRRQTREAFRRMLREQSADKPFAEAALRVALGEALLLFLRGERRRGRGLPDREQRFWSTVDYIEEHFREPLPVEELAALCGLSSRRYQDWFKQRMGATVVAYLQARRIRCARERLLETGRIGYAAHESGFNDLGYFYRVFKQQTGLTPRQYLHGGGRPQTE